jgi:hypothetical protein
MVLRAPPILLTSTRHARLFWSAEGYPNGVGVGLDGDSIEGCFRCGLGELALGGCGGRR